MSTDKSKTYRIRHRSEILEKQYDWRQNNKEKRFAHSKVQNAVRTGRLIRPGNCEQCFKECAPSAHHEDYSKPLDVLWLCHACHHKKHGFSKPEVIKLARGERHGRVKLNELKVRIIRSMRSAGWENRRLGRFYGVSEKLIRMVVARKIWTHVP